MHADSLSALFPTLVIHTLVENAMRHGIAPRSTTGKVILEVNKKSDQLVLMVSDNGPGLQKPPEEAFSKGIGLRNTRERLKQLYGDDFTFALHNLNGSGFGVVVAIPFRTSSRQQGRARDHSHD